MLIAGIDPQMHLSRTSEIQPFYLICEKDTVLVQMSGHGTLHLKKSGVRRVDMKPGDHVYIPGGAPSRYGPSEDGVLIRYKAEKPGLEAVEWNCPDCDADLAHIVFDTAKELSQEGYLRACAEFNDNADRRACKQCGSVHPPIDLSRFHWKAIVETLRNEE